ncbi:MAG: hypothetical protein J6R33_01070 [Clostridia bacterium]|nr:hypothetical protein [Clostridia bacterium]
MTDYERIKREYDLSLLGKLAQTVRHLPTIEDLWPVGSIYLSLDPTNPATRFGGVWERIENAFLLAASNAHPVGETGGEERHALSVDELPSHKHDGIYFWDYELTYDNSVYPGAGYAAAVNVNGSTRFNTGYAGGGASHNNMPPYLSVYMWKRVG